MPTPSVTLSQPLNPFIGQSFDLTLSFDNPGTATGYGPFASLFLDTTGIDGNDGISLNSASYLGGSVTTTEITLSGNSTETITVHGVEYELDVSAALASGFQAGDSLIVFELPFGSFVPGQPPADIEITLDTSNLADLNKPLSIEGQGGFIFGDSQTGTTPILQTTNDSTSVTPQLVTLTKNYLGTESETATGPNFVRQYEIVVDIAEGQTIENLDVTDILPDTMQFVDVASITTTTSPAPTISDLGTPDDGGLTSIGTTNTTENDVNSDGIPLPGGTLIRRFDSVTGTSSDRDIVITIDFFVPRLDASSAVIIDATTGDDILDENQSELGDNNTGDVDINVWDPLDGRDGQEEVFISRNSNDGSNPTVEDDESDPNDPDHILEEQSIAIQKGVRNHSNPEANAEDEIFVPGDILKYTLDFQVSDYFAFEDVFVTDTFSDGQRFYNASGFEPVLSFNEHGNTPVSNAAFTNTVHTPVSSGNGTTTVLDFLTVNETDIGHTNDGSGNTVLTFDVSDLLATQTEQDVQLVGGGVPDGGFTAYNAANDPDIGLQNNPILDTGFGGTTGTITFYTQVQEEYSDNFPSGDASIDAGDKLTNSAVIDGAVLDVDTLVANGEREDDDTFAQIEIASGELYKSIYAIDGVVASGADTDLDPSNGVTGYTSGIDVAPGQLITYRLTYELPVADVENFTLEDFLPLPAYDVADFSGSLTVASINSSDDGAADLTDAPGSGLIEFGPAHSFPDDINSLSINSSTNSVLLDFGDYDDTNNNSAIVDVLVTLPIKDEPVADGLLFTNQVHQEQQNTFNETVEDDAIIQITLRQPELNITKGVVAFSSDNTNSFDPATSAPSGVTFATGGGTSFTGVVSSTNLLATPIDSNLTGGLAAGDIVTFAIAVENIGISPDGAFDVTIQDDLPTGFQIPDGTNELNLTGINLEVTDGTGTAISYTGSDTDLFGAGIELVDNASTGAIAAYSDTSGANIAIVTFDLEVTEDALSLGSIENTATLASFANTEGGTDFASKTDTATVEIEQITTATKSIVETSEAHTTDANDVAIGEIVRYQLAVTVPEGNFDNFQITDNLPAGLLYLGNPKLAFIADESASGIDSSTISGSGLDIPGFAPTTPTFDLTTGVTSAVGGDSNFTSGEDVIFSLGNLTNNDRDNNDEFVVIEFNALVENIASNQTATGVLPNDFTVSATGITDVTSNEVTLDIVEPVIDNVSKVVNTSIGDADDTFTYTITFSNTGNATAFDLNIADTLPTELDNLGSITTTIFDDSTPTPVDVTSSFTITPTSTSSTNGVADDSDAVDAFSIGIDELPVGYSVQVEFTADVVGDIAPETSFDNNATVTYSSLPGDGTASNPTGSTTPGTSGDADGDRNGDGGVNDYTDSNDTPATVTIDNVDGVKSIIATSESHTSETGDGSSSANARDVAIGEIVRYRLVTEIPEGQIENVILRDHLSRGLTFLNDGTAEVAFVSTSGTGINSTDPTGSTLSLGLGTAPGTSNTGNSPDDVTTFTTLGDNAIASNDSITTDQDNYTNGSFSRSGVDVRFKLGNITNNDNDADSEYIVVEFNALVDNTVTTATNISNDAGENRNNFFRVFSDGTQLDQSNTVRVNIVEPAITATKLVESTATTSGSPYAADDDDSVTFSVTFNHTNANGNNDDDNTDGFDLVLTDNLPTELDLTSIDSIQVNDGATTQNATVGGTETITTAILDGDGATPINIVVEDTSNLATDDVGLKVDRLPKEASVTVTYTANITGTIAPEQLIQNTASIEYTSIPGTNGTTSNSTDSTVPGASGEGYGERDGSDGENADPDSNDYLDTSDGFIQVPAVDPVKSIVATSETHTGTAEGASATDEDVAIGEIVRYRLVTQIPESTDTNYQITDFLPDGLLYLDGSANVSLVSTNGQTNGLTSSVITDTNVYSSDPNVTPVVPITAVDSNDVGSDFSSGEDPTFNLGTLANLDNDSDTEFVVIEFNALVENIVANQDPGTLSNSFQVSSDNTTTQTSDSISVDIVEPLIELPTKTASSSTADAGDTLTYTISFTNTGNADAFDVNLIDNIPAELENFSFSIDDVTLVDGSSTLTGAAAGASINTGTGNDLDLLISEIPVNASVTVEYTADVVSGVSPDGTIDNTASLTYTSLPGDGTTSNPTGSDTPGTSGDADGERNGTGGVNEYSDSATEQVTIQPLAPVKSLVETSESHTSDNDVAIGEIVRYQLSVAIPEGVTNNFQITDNLPDGLLYLGNPKLAFVADENVDGIDSSTISGAGLDITDTAPTTPTFDLTTGVTSAIGGDSTFTSGEDVIFSLGNLTNNDRDSEDDEYVVIEFNALVENIASNQAATGVLGNDFTVTATDVTTRTSNEVTVDIVEPVITDVLKEANTDNADAGDTVSYTITFSNTGADAFDLDITDALPDGLDNVIVTSTIIRDNSLVDVTSSFTVDTSTTTSSTNDVIDDSDATDALNITIDRLNANHSVEITYTATVVDDIVIGSIVDNTVDVAYSSLPGDGTTSNPTGSETPGTSGDADGDRNGSGTGANDYSDSDSDQVDINSYSLGSTVFTDTDNDGTQDAGELGISGVTVQLFDDSNNEILVGADGILGTVDDGTGGMLTDGSGNYFFTDLPPGDYKVVIPVSNFDSGTGALANATVSSIVTDTNDNGQDGDDNGIQTGGASTQVESPIINLSAGNEPTTTETADGETQDDATTLLDSNGDMTVDFGFVPAASIGNKVFFDNDRDGIQSGSDLGVEGVTVTLVSGGDDGLISTTGDNPAAITTTTDVNGEYSFTDLTPGIEYQVTFEPATIPTGATFTTADAGSDDAIDSDANISTGETPIITLTPGESNDSIDTGIIKNTITGTGSPETLTGSANGDLIIGGKGEDTLAGGAGNDCFHFNETSEGIDTITDFTPGEDKIDLSSILADEVTAYSSGDPFTQDYVEMVEFTLGGITSTIVQIDFDAGDESTVNDLYAKDVVILQGVALGSLDTSRDFII